jgi:hypothetical protein
MADVPTPGKPTGGSLVLALRLLLVVIAAWAVFAAVLARQGADRAADGRVRYVCPMHADVTSSVPGACPLCGMDLEEENANGPGPPTAVVAAVRSSTYFSYDVVRRRAYGPNTPAPAWVEDDGTVTAVLYADELVFRTPEEQATFSPSSAPGTGTEVRATSDPLEPWDASTRRVHFRPAAPLPPLRPREVGWLKRAMRSPEPPVISDSAILESQDGPYVLALSADGRMLGKRSVEIGRVFGGVATVLSGLRSSERILTGSTFFVDAERRLRRATTIDVAPR